jgi:hypothetical protein
VHCECLISERVGALMREEDRPRIIGVFDPRNEKKMIEIP